jgi:hypothetical protein
VWLIGDGRQKINDARYKTEENRNKNNIPLPLPKPIRDRLFKGKGQAARQELDLLRNFVLIETEPP